MRMPIFSYFLVVGSVLTVLLLWFGTSNEPNVMAPTSPQTVGIPKFQPEPEPEHARVTAANLAAEYERSETKPVKAADIPRRQKTAITSPQPQIWNRFAEFPQGNLNIH